MQTGEQAELMEVNKLISKRCLTEAKVICSRLVEENPNSIEARRLPGLCLLREGFLTEAEAYLTTVRAEDPLNATILVNIGYLREEQGRLDEAELLLMLALMLDPTNDFAHGRFGNLMRRLGRESAMEAFYGKLMDLFPKELLESEPFYRSVLSVAGPLKHPKERRAYAAKFAVHAPAADIPSGSAVVRERGDRLRQTGFVPLGRLLNISQIREIHSYFDQKPTFNALLPELSDKNLRPIQETMENSNYACYRQEDIIRAPHLLELINHPDILLSAADALGCQPTLYSINVWWSFPQETPSEHAQSFHRDVDDFLFTTVFIYLTDVDDMNGPHVYCEKTHDVSILEKYFNSYPPRVAVILRY